MYRISYKDESVLQNFMEDMHPIMQDLFVWVCDEFEKTWAEVVVTCAYEKRAYVSVHSVLPYRGIDLRSSHLKNPRRERDYINNRWMYDPHRPNLKCCIYHNVGRGAHLHLQVSDNTTKRLMKSVV